MSLTWSDVAEGDALPTIEFAVSYTTLALDVAGTRDPYPIHHDPDFAHANGVEKIFLNTMWYQGMAGRLVGQWGGPDAFLRNLKVDMRANTGPGDDLTVRGSVTRRYVDNDRHLVDVDIRMDNQKQTDAVIVAATVELPADEPEEQP
jgi:acyl dehydratase